MQFDCTTKVNLEVPLFDPVKRESNDITRSIRQRNPITSVFFLSPPMALVPTANLVHKCLSEFAVDVTGLPKTKLN